MICLKYSIIAAVSPDFVKSAKALFVFKPTTKENANEIVQAGVDFVVRNADIDRPGG
jgi:hypothetical protein